MPAYVPEYLKSKNRQSADGNQIMFLNLIVVRFVYKGHLLQLHAHL